MLQQRRSHGTAADVCGANGDDGVGSGHGEGKDMLLRETQSRIPDRRSMTRARIAGHLAAARRNRPLDEPIHALRLVAAFANT